MFALALLTTAAQADNFIGCAGYVYRSDMSGYEVQGGYRFTYGDLGLNLLPLSAVLHTSKPTRVWVNGREHKPKNFCLKPASQADELDNLCFDSVDFSAVIGADLRLTARWALGAGMRLGKINEGYTSLSYLPDRGMSLQLKLGERYVGLAAGLGF